MSVHAFGNSVDEVQRKLNEILPMVDTGIERVREIQDQLVGELETLGQSFQTMTESFEQLGTAAVDVDQSLGETRSAYDAQRGSCSSQIADAENAYNDAMTELNGAQQRVTAELAEAVEQVDTKTTSMEAEADSLLANSNAVQQSIGSLQERSDTTFADLTTQVNEHTQQWEADDASSQQALQTMRTTVSQKNSDDVTKTFNGLNDSTVTAVTNIVGLLSDQETGISEFFAAFDTDADTLVEQFKQQTRETFGELRDYTESQCGDVIEESLERLAREVVEALAAEVVSCVATAQLGAATTAALSPIIPQLAIAKKVTGVINSIL